MTVKYLENGVDLDYTYIDKKESNYFPLETLNITGRKVVTFGQNLITNTYTLANLGNPFNTSDSVSIPKLDMDDVTLEAVTYNAVFYKNSKGETLIRGDFTSSKNTPQTKTAYWATTLYTDRYSPVQVGSLSDWVVLTRSSSSTLALKNNGTIWAWGSGIVGQLGLSDTTNRSSPVQVGYENNWEKIFNFYSTPFAIKTDGTLWGWGGNSNGQLGVSDLTHRYQPTQIGTTSDWNTVDGGYYHTSAIKTDGTLWTWGNNSYGQLGLSDLTRRLSPVQVGSSSDWSKISCGYSTTLAVKTDGTLWAWGNNSNGQLGLSDLTHRYSPVQVGTSSDWNKALTTSIKNSFAIKTDGTLWAWGVNSYGQLGQNDLTHRSSPTQIGSLGEWREISSYGNTILATKTDNTLWSWGLNAFGQLGVSNLTTRYSPVQVGTLSDWNSIGGSTSMNASIKFDGTLWTWGSSVVGYLGSYDTGASPTKLIYGI